MLTSKYLSSFSCLLIIFLCNLTRSIYGVPLPDSKPALNTTNKGFPNSTGIRGSQQATKRPINRNPRLLGKLSLLAGLGLPEVASPTITRNDIFSSHRSPTEYSVSYNYPPKRWGPYIAAVYEPLPILSFFQNPLAYLTALLNPFNWFHGSGSTNSLTSPANIVVESIASDKNQDNDIVLLVQDPDNEISNEDHTIDKIEVKMEQDNNNDARLHDVINNQPLNIKRNDVIANFATIENDIVNEDLIAEETTARLLKDMKIKDRQEVERLKATTHKMKKHNVTTTSKSTTAKSTKIMSSTLNSNNILTTEGYTTTNSFNDSSNINNWNSTSKSNISHPNSDNSYYFDGHPQNISNIEFTSQASTNSFIPVRYQNFNEINRFFQYPQYSNNYYNSYKTQPQESFNHLNHFEQLPPTINDYYSRKLEFLPNNDNFLFNGFKPSFPFYIQS